MRRELRRVTDYFALLDQPRSAWLDVDALKLKFHERARTEHPDAGGTTFQELNAAYRVLADAKSRLAHLLELNGAKAAAIAEPPEDLVEMFFEVGKALSAAKAGAFEQLETELKRVVAARDATLEALRSLDVTDNESLRVAHQRLAFLDRWHAQLTETRLAAAV